MNRELVATLIPRSRTLMLLLAACIMAACAGPQATAGTISVELAVDGQVIDLQVGAGTSVREALDRAGVELSELDRIEPRSNTVLTDGTRVTVTRVVETFEIEEVVIPFERQTLRNESLPEGERRLLQPGRNGLEEITYRIVTEAGIEASRSPVKRSVIEAPQPEIVMVGAQASYAPVAVEGTLAYLSAGNAWILRGDTGGRRPLVVSGDLDGFVFRLSPDSRWLLFSRHEDSEADINSLWVVSTVDPDAEPRPIGVRNVVHFADWAPTPPYTRIAYSTVEPSPAAPGWQANNDLQLVTLAASGRVLDRAILLESNAGGQYGWWGSSFVWSPDGFELAYARADSIGLVTLPEDDGEPARTETLLEITPLQTFGDWAWVPGLAWGHSGGTLYLIDHGQPVGLENPSASPAFDLVALNPFAGFLQIIVERTGMFAFPAASPAERNAAGEIVYLIAFMQAISPLDSRDSSYQLMLMDRDASNLRRLFPPAGDPGIEPPQQPPAWSPDGKQIALLYRGDLWVVDVESALGQTLTADGQTEAFDWKP